MKVRLLTEKGAIAFEFYMTFNTHAPVRPQTLQMYQASYEFDRTIKHREGGQTVVMRRVG